MLDKILKKLGYVKSKPTLDEEQVKKLEKLKKDFTSLMTYSLEKSIKRRDE